MTTAEHERIKALEREVRELRRANESLRTAWADRLSALLGKAGLKAPRSR